MESDSGQLICQLVWLLDQDWQAPRTDMKLLALELQGKKRCFHFGRAAIEAR